MSVKSFVKRVAESKAKLERELKAKLDRGEMSVGDFINETHELRKLEGGPQYVERSERYFGKMSDRQLRDRMLQAANLTFELISEHFFRDIEPR